jgi:hypothetical protein
MAYKPPTREIESLLELCQISLDPEADAYEMPRFFQVTLWVDGPNKKTTLQEFNRFRSLALAELKANNCSQTGVKWGPFDGSRFISLFGKSNDELSGPSFKERLKSISEGLRSKFGTVSTGTKVLLIVGGTAITIAGGPAAAAVLFHVPLVVTKSIVIGGSVASAGTQLRKLFEKKSTAADATTPTPAPDPSPATVAREEAEESKKDAETFKRHYDELRKHAAKVPKLKR